MGGYGDRFSELAGGHNPHPYQERVAEKLFERRHLVVRAPTGAGKTLAVLVPFLVDRDLIGVRGMIYVLPLRTLVEAVYQEALALGGVRGFRVAMQTGERADAELFCDADIIVTTFDQLLSGLLCEPETGHTSSLSPASVPNNAASPNQKSSRVSPRSLIICSPFL